ncbi:hypothetical protein [Mesorhizobium sp.]|uniref:hypothetical protein n=1 Tax=Mesorhizobium sp. TaxID=1871066 RepID=UPI000FE61684|nr:hypothetical protein [Mesorhizobium sp.]RWG04048.1 MAG: hypothetical protein EOQ54_15260 [Mesorhizobium sp.]RWG98798.1 MAG: hypothetical protein EOQ72_14965 [Mesorhizobium sp.]RWH30672.1 MAG: hypothetical protein EOQ76_11720 [Mesorhizobium sp.]RWH35804.1 MAG: hypothetical protein EOQ79_20330 [Mesorhizobium sp.]TIM70980.1 MAG: hypothetical protein E5Y52_00570 [Mesorhizobium sp.]
MTGRPRDRIIETSVIGAFLAIWAYAEFSPYHRCIRGYIRDRAFLAGVAGSPFGARYHAEHICEVLVD